MCRIFMFLLSFWCCSSVIAQDYTVNFIKGQKQLEQNAATLTESSQLQSNEMFKQRFYRFVQFNSMPTTAEKATLAAKGIRLLEYIPNYVYLASIPVSVDFSEWQALNIRSIAPLETTYKIDRRLENKQYPSWSLDGDKITVNIQYHKDLDADVVMEALFTQFWNSVELIEPLYHTNMAVIKLAKRDLEKLANAAFIRYVDILPDPGTPESDDGRHLHRAHAIDGAYAGARKYDGTGITVAVNDDGFVGPHIDFTGRTNQQDVANDFTGDHGDMVAGIVGGAGNLNPLMRGMATGSYMHIRQYSANMAGTVQLHVDSSVLVFSSSYSNGCNAGYTNIARAVDQQVHTYPTLMHTFSGGNSNNNDCGYGAGSQWGNITGGHKMGKNVIATANINEQDVILNSSSRGPASDGRIKPDISAHGNNQMSTDPNNTYAPGGGTSAAAPGICGVMAQLHQAYQELNGGTVAPSALLKVAMLATANDLGNDGPDFIYGWGKINALKAVKVLEENRYLNSTIAQGGSNTHSITIPAGVKRAKIMVYWSDEEGSTSASTALVNDLDCTIEDPSATTHLPWLLDHTPNASALAAPATKGADHLNNMEQIAIDNPTAGTYTLKIDGTTVPFGAQEYYVVYEFLTDEVTVIHPMGGEGLVAGMPTRIHWDAHDDNGTFNIELTTDNGITWSTIASNVNASARFLGWTPPASLVTGEARIRITRGGFTGESVANFTVIGRPDNINVTRICTNISAIQIEWDPVPGAVGYDVYVLGQKYMDSVGTTTDLYFNVPVNDVYAPQWFSVRALAPNGGNGLRQIAVFFDGEPGDCYLACTSDDDAGVMALRSPQGGLEVCNGSNVVPVTIALENIGLNPEMNFPVYYQLDNNPVVMEMFMDTLNPSGNKDYTFTTGITVPAQGTYTLKTWTGLGTDATVCNDTLIQSLQSVAPLGSFPYVEDFQAATFPSPNAYVTNSDNDNTWVSAIGLTGSAGIFTKALRMSNWQYDGGQGEEDMFTLALLDLTNAASAELSFDVAYRIYQFRADRLRVEVSTDCGATFNSVYDKSGFVLATGGIIPTIYIPTNASDWRNDVIDLSAYVGNEVIVRFVSTSANGNNLYIDNINIDVTPFTNIETLNNQNDWSVQPNPTTGKTSIVLDQALEQSTKLEVVGMDGRVLLEEQLSVGTTQKTLNLEELPTGMYLVRLSNNTMIETNKVLIK